MRALGKNGRPFREKYSPSSTAVQLAITHNTHCSSTAVQLAITHNTHSSSTAVQLAITHNPKQLKI